MSKEKKLKTSMSDLRFPAFVETPQLAKGTRKRWRELPMGARKGLTSGQMRFAADKLDLKLIALCASTSEPA
jgi:hypothetical protein